MKKRGPGRPRLPSAQKRRNKVHIAFTDAELRIVTERAAAKDQTPPEFVRSKAVS
jgi:hypothetical protein